MGVDDYLLVATVRGIIAQRLVRKLCPHCAKRVPASSGLLARFEVPDLMRELLMERGVMIPSGCGACNGIGYRGRTTISEILSITPGIQEIILGGASVRDVEMLAQKEGMHSLSSCGLALVAAGETSLDEVLRAAGTQ
jgi:general secretion pathway protein E